MMMNLKHNKKLQSFLPFFTFLIVIIFSLFALLSVTQSSRLSYNQSNLAPLAEYSEQNISLNNNSNLTKTLQNEILAQASDIQDLSDNQSCSQEKFGVNLLVGPGGTKESYSQIKALKMGYFLNTLNDPSEIQDAINAVNSGLTPVFRFCYADQVISDTGGIRVTIPNEQCNYSVGSSLIIDSPCASGNATADTIIAIARGSNTDKKIIASPVNEAVSESWATGVTDNSVKFKERLPQFYSCFSEKIRSATDVSDKIVIAGPTFNVRHDDGQDDGIESFVKNFNNFVAGGGDKYIDIWTFNFYSNVPGQSDYNQENTLEFIASTVKDNKPWGINETGDFNGDIGALKSGVESIASNSKVNYALFFNALGQGNSNPDAGDQWAKMNLDQDSLNTIFSDISSCVSAGLPDPQTTFIANQLDPETADPLEVPNHWNLRSCQVKPVSINLNENNIENRTALSPDGEVKAGLKLNKCDDNNQNSKSSLVNSDFYTYDCKRETNWTAGYAYTGGIKSLPLINFLAQDEKTEANAVNPYCWVVAKSNITTKDKIWSLNDGSLTNFTIQFSSKFPGLARFLNTATSETVNIKTPLLGGASACGIVNWSEVVADPLDTIGLRIHPLSMLDIKHTGGVSLKNNIPEDNFISKVLNTFLAGLGSLIDLVTFTEPTNPSNNTYLDQNNYLCKNIPGEDVNTLRQTEDNATDGIELKFWEEEGAFEYLIENPTNFELTPKEVCDAQFGTPGGGPQTIIVEGNSFEVKVVGAICYLKDENGNTRTYKDDGNGNMLNAEQAGFIGKQRYINENGDSEVLCSGDSFQDGSTVPFTKICDIEITCQTPIDLIYQACRRLDGENNIPSENIDGDPYMRFERPGFNKTDFIGLAKYIYNVWEHERLNTNYRIIHNVNAGINTKWEINLYDLQSPLNSPKNVDADFLSAINDYNELLKTDAYNTPSVIGPDELPNHPLKEYVSFLEKPNQYLPVYTGNYNRAATSSGNKETGVSNVVLEYTFPWLGQIPMMLERTSVLSTSQNNIVGRSFENRSECNASEAFKDDKLKELGLDFCGCDCPNGEEICDCISSLDPSHPSFGLTDPLEEWLFSPISQGGAGFSYGNRYGPENPLQCYYPAFNGETQAPRVDLSDFSSPFKSANSDFILTQCFGSTKDKTQLINCKNTYTSLGFKIIDGYNEPTNLGYDGTFFHTGVDIANGASDRDIYAVADGKVVKKVSSCPSDYAGKPIDPNCGAGYGNNIVIEHTLKDNSVIYTRYAHLAGVATNIKLNEPIRKGQLLGTMGTSGKSSGIHLHLELFYRLNDRKKENFLDPSLIFENKFVNPNLENPLEECCNLLPNRADDVFSLIRKATDYINHTYGSRVPWYTIASILRKESALRCVDTYSEWYSSATVVQTLKSSNPKITIYTDTCTGDPNQLTLWKDKHPVDVFGKGIAQQMPNRFLRIVTNRPLWSIYDENRDNSTELLNSCMDFLGVNRNIGQEIPGQEGGTYYDSITDPLIRNDLQRNYSRHRIGDVICATVIDIGESARYQRLKYENQSTNGYIPVEQWNTNDFIYAGRAWYYNTETCFGKSYCQDIALLSEWMKQNLEPDTFIDCTVTDTGFYDTPITGQVDGTTCPVSSPDGHKCFQGPYGNNSHCDSNGLPIDLNPFPINLNSDMSPNLSEEKLRIVAPENGIISNKSVTKTGGFIELLGDSGIKYILLHFDTVHSSWANGPQINQRVNVEEKLGELTVKAPGRGGIYSVNDIHLHARAEYNGQNVDPYLIYGQLLGCNASAPPSYALQGTLISLLPKPLDGKQYCSGKNQVLNDNSGCKYDVRAINPEIVCELFGGSCSQLKERNN